MSVFTTTNLFLEISSLIEVSLLIKHIISNFDIKSKIEIGNSIFPNIKLSNITNLLFTNLKQQLIVVTSHD